MSAAELASSYAALILADEGLEITVRPPMLPLCAMRAEKKRKRWIVMGKEYTACNAHEDCINFSSIA
jgi:hypothetical protein